LEAWVGDDEGRRCDEEGMLRVVERLEFPGREGRRRRRKGKDINTLYSSKMG
jgi:hypothetical protein